MFQSEMNFMRLPGEHCSPESYFYIMQIPYDATTSFVAGTRTGPGAIINASTNLELYDMETETEAWKKGIHTMPPIEVHSGSAENMHKRIRKVMDGVVKPDRFVISLGGEHSISSACIAAHREKFGEITVVQFDAHADLREHYEDSEYSHASVMRRVNEDVGSHIVQIGIRSMDSTERDFLCGNDDITCISACSVHNDMEMSLNLLKRMIKERKVYISFDIDAFDSGLVWKTGTPEPGGLDWKQVNTFLSEIFRCSEVVGADVVELIGGEPANDSLAAKLVYRMMGYKVG
ncbi:MAG: agmatinase [Candidatus Muiribacteriaceae bacterium]